MPAELQFIHGAMGSRKTAEVLMLKYNYEERGRRVLLLKPKVDNRDGDNIIRSRAGMEARCEVIDENFDINKLDLFHINNGQRKYDFVIIDEAQFLTPEQVDQLAVIVDEFDVPVICYGLRTDFQGKMFPGSARLLAIADEIRQIDPVCWCGRRAIMNARLSDGKVVKQGEQVVIGGDERYVSLCRKHWEEKNIGPLAEKLNSEREDRKTRK